MTTSNTTKAHSGSCHCQKVRYEATLDASKGTACNCSICSRKGTVLSFVPADKFRLLSGADQLTDYQFGKQRIHHLFCRTCGVASFARGTGPDGKEMVAVNLRCLDGFDLGAATVTQFDGKSL